MKKVGIVSCYFKNNYGSLLQAYATKKVLDNNNIPNETINIRGNIDFKKGKRKYYLSQLFNYKFIKSKSGMIKLKFDKIVNKKLRENLKIRNLKYMEFKHEFNLSRMCRTYNDLKNLAIEEYDNVIVGSDQLWLPVNVVADYYTLNWVPDEINKISYATSFGFSKVPKKYNLDYYNFLSRINCLSTREESGVEIIKEITSLDAKLVADPTLLLSKEEWEKEINTERVINDKYILCYFLGNNIEHRKFVEKLKAKTGFKIVSLNHSDEYVKYNDIFCDMAPYDIGPREWINLIKNSEVVCTDSFHGTVFSIIFNKIFFDFRRHNSKSKVSTNSRIDSLLHIAGIDSNRILTGLENVEDVLNLKIDYTIVNENIKKFREESKKWLLDSIKTTLDKSKTIESSNKYECCGCTACKSICPQNAIKMKEDKEGFLYPNIDKEKCVECGLCRGICPVINVKTTKKEQKGYILNNNNINDRKDSTSGGFITPLAEYVLDKKGVVFGSVLDKKLNVIHVKIDKKDNIRKIRKSKYVQSDLKNTFMEAKNELESGKLVLYTGTPCQIEGLLKYLNKDFENLITVDNTCHSIPSPKFYNKYKEFVKKKRLHNEEIKDVIFRDKSLYGYRYSVMTTSSMNYKSSLGMESDEFLRGFFEDLAVRPSCYSCSFKKRYPESDFRIWDCFFPENFDEKFNDNLGTTRLLINTKKGKILFNKIIDKYDCTEIPVNKLMSGSKELFESVRKPLNRDEFFRDMDSMSLECFFKKYFSYNLKIRIKRTIKIVMAKTGIYNKVKKFVYKLRGE